MVIKLRNFQLGDEEALFEVFYSSIHIVCAKDYTPEQITAWAPDDLDEKIWKAKFQSLNPFIATIGDKVVGYSDVQKDGLIDHFFVHGEFQRCGIGARLMEEVLYRGVCLDELYSEVSHTARPFFEKFGFKLVKEQLLNMRGVDIGNNVMKRKMN